MTTRQKKRRISLRWRETRTGWAFLFPSFLGVMIFILVPFIDVCRRSFLDAMGKKSAGFDNYKTVIQNESFLRAVENTGRFLITCIPLLLLVSLLMALLIHFYVSIHKRGSMAHKNSNTGKKRGECFKTSYLIPMAIPVASIVLLWKLLFHEKGLLNGIMMKFGTSPIDFMNSEYAFYVLVFTYLWKNTGYDMILWLAGLGGISDSLYEAASVDGAGGWKKFWYITMPSLKPVLFITGVLSLANSFKVFREAYLISGDYPDNSIYMLQHIFNNWFTNLDMQKMCAAAVLTAIAVLLIIGLFALITGRDEKG